MPPRVRSSASRPATPSCSRCASWSGRTVGVGAIPYRAAIPIAMHGDNVGLGDEPWLGCLRTLQEWAETFPASKRRARARRCATASNISGASARRHDPCMTILKIGPSLSERVGEAA